MSVRNWWPARGPRTIDAHEELARLASLHVDKERASERRLADVTDGLT